MKYNRSTTLIPSDDATFWQDLSRSSYNIARRRAADIQIWSARVWQKGAAREAAKARRLMGITDEDQFYG